MRKLLLALAVVVAVPVGAMAQWSASPDTWDYGDVEIGSSESLLVTIQNLGSSDMLVFDLIVGGADASEFVITAGPVAPFVAKPNEPVDIEVSYVPADLGESLAYLRIEVTGSDHGSESVYLSGKGVESEPPPEQVIQDILDFIDDSVSAGDLSGSGPGNSASGRLNALVNMVESAGDLIEEGDYETAFDQLETVYKKCDGETPPPDFVEGDAREELAGMILDLMADLLELM